MNAEDAAVDAAEVVGHQARQMIADHHAEIVRLNTDLLNAHAIIQRRDDEIRKLVTENGRLLSRVGEQPPDPTDEERDRRRDMDYAREFERSADWQDRRSRG